MTEVNDGVLKICRLWDHALSSYDYPIAGICTLIRFHSSELCAIDSIDLFRDNTMTLYLQN